MRMPHVIIGTAGHIDHGKTSLVKALTGIDVAGHERFVKNMLAGVGGIDAVILVIAADESVMPQTREHLDICSLLHVKRGLTALTKIDATDRELVDLAE